VAKPDLKTEHRLLTILTLLKDDPDYKIDFQLLQASLKLVGFGVSSVVLMSDLTMLEEMQLISTSNMAGITLAILRNRGVDVADGVTVVPGIARPRPE